MGPENTTHLQSLRTVAVRGTEVGADCSPVFHLETAQTSIRQVCATSVTNLRGQHTTGSLPRGQTLQHSTSGCSKGLRRKRIDTPLRSGRGGTALCTCA